MFYILKFIKALFWFTDTVICFPRVIFEFWTQSFNGYIKILNILLLQWKPLNVIASVQTQTDNINRMITIAEVKSS